MSYGIWRKHQTQEGWSSIEIDSPHRSQISEIRATGEWAESYDPERKEWYALRSKMRWYNDQRGMRPEPYYSAVTDEDNPDWFKWAYYQRKKYPNRFFYGYSFGGGEHYTSFSYDNLKSLLHCLNYHATDRAELRDVFTNIMRDNHANLVQFQTRETEGGNVFEIIAKCAGVIAFRTLELTNPWHDEQTEDERWDRVKHEQNDMCSFVMGKFLSLAFKAIQQRDWEWLDELTAANVSAEMLRDYTAFPWAKSEGLTMKETHIVSTL